MKITSSLLPVDKNTQMSTCRRWISPGNWLGRIWCEGRTCIQSGKRTQNRFLKALASEEPKQASVKAIDRQAIPPFSFHVMALVALLHLPDGQIWMQPVELFRLQVRQQETVTASVLYVRPQSTADQDWANDCLADAKTDTSDKRHCLWI